MKYLVEGGINFFEELNKPTPVSVTVPRCLITNDPLTELSVTLSCGHAFNYVPLYNEVRMQKMVKNCLEISKLSHCELKCPYCRKVQSGLLPFHESCEKMCPKVSGVNSELIAVKPTISIHLATKCTALLKSGEHKGESCTHLSYANSAGLCTRHYNLSLKAQAKALINVVSTV